MISLYDIAQQVSKRALIVQRGVVAATTAGVNVTISKVNPARCMLLVASGRATNDAITFVDNKTIKVTTSLDGNVAWQVVEMGVDE